MKMYHKSALGNECSEYKNTLCSTKDFTKGLILRVKQRDLGQSQCDLSDPLQG